MRKMYDAVNIDNMPLDADFFGYYVDGKYVPTQEQLNRFAGKHLLGIAVFETTNAGIIGDSEFMDMSPEGLVRWVVMRRNDGVWPTGYCSFDNWNACISAFTSKAIQQPPWLIAAMPGNGAQLYTDAIGHQWIDHGGYDESVIADVWPGIDPKETPTINEVSDIVKTSEVALVTAEVNGIAVGWIAAPAPADNMIKAKVIAPNPEKGTYYDVPIWTYEVTEPGPNSPNGSLVFRGGAVGQYAVSLAWHE